MKLARFTFEGGAPEFGVVIGGEILSFKSLMQALGCQHPELLSMEGYLAGLPGSHGKAKEMIERVDLTKVSERYSLAVVKFLAPLSKPPAIIDFGLSPRHLQMSLQTLIRHDKGKLVEYLAKPFIKRKLKKMVEEKAMPYYKCNHNEVIGDGDTVGWPIYTSYLDIEPELGIVAGTDEQPIAGYVIYNDVSARDVQMPEMVGGAGPARCKDFSRAQGLGPFLVTSDEIANPLDLKVTAKIGERFVWHGSTSEYCAHPEEVIRYLRTIFIPLPGTVVGMGTIPDCTGLDNDEWLWPGDAVEISFTGLGTLHQQIPQAPKDLEPSRWKYRPELERCQ